MAQSLTSLLAHIVFGTKNRVAYLQDMVHFQSVLAIGILFLITLAIKNNTTKK